MNKSSFSHFHFNTRGYHPRGSVFDRLLPAQHLQPKPSVTPSLCSKKSRAPCPYPQRISDSVSL